MTGSLEDRLIASGLLSDPVLRRTVRRRADLIPVLEGVYGRDKAKLWSSLWRVFFITCEEMFSLDGGREYFVGHYLFGPTE